MVAVATTYQLRLWIPVCQIGGFPQTTWFRYLVGFTSLTHLESYVN